jgi:hypothetical protein
VYGLAGAAIAAHVTLGAASLIARLVRGQWIVLHVNETGEPLPWFRLVGFTIGFAWLLAACAILEWSPLLYDPALAWAKTVWRFWGF